MASADVHTTALVRARDSLCARARELISSLYPHSAADVFYSRITKQMGARSDSPTLYSATAMRREEIKARNGNGNGNGLLAVVDSLCVE